MVTLVFEAKYGVIFWPFLRDMLVWRTLKAASEIPLLDPVLGHAKVADLQNWSKIENIVLPYRFGPLRHAL